MRAIVFDTFGNPDVLSLQDVACPEPGPGQVRVAIYAAGTNPVDTQNRQGGSWVGLHPPVIPGSDASRVIDAVSPGVLQGEKLTKRSFIASLLPRENGC